MSLGQSLLWLRNPYAYLDHALATRGPTFRARLPVMGSCLLTGDPALVEEIEQNRDLIGGRGTRALRPVVGDDSMIVLEGAKHEKHRRVFVPPFFGGRTQVDALTAAWTEQALAGLKPGAQASGIELVTGITLNVIVEVVFGAFGDDRRRRAVALIERWMLSFSMPIVLFVRALHLDFGPRSPWGRFRRNREAVEAFIREELERRRGEPGGGLLGHALARSAEGETLGDDELVSETITFLLFGHDTTAAAMAWVIHHLGAHPAVRERVAEEWRRERGGAAAPDPERLPYTRAAVEESMRLCPVVVHLTRHAVRPTRVGPHAIAQDERVLPSAYLSHRNPAVFDQPAAYRPERFLGGAGYRRAYFPFGIGSRLCAGMPFALRQMLIITGMLAARPDYQLAGAAAVRPVRKMVLIVPSGGAPLRRAA